MKKKKAAAFALALIMAVLQPFGSISYVSADNLSGNVRNISNETISKNSVSTDSISENLISDDSISENDILDDSVSDNSVSQNNHFPKKTPVFAREGGFLPDSLQNGLGAERETDGDSTDNGTEAVSEKPRLDGVSITALSMASYKSIGITWNGVKDAEGYEIYRSTNMLFGYTLVKSAGKDVLAYTDKSKKLTVGKKYYYKVRAVATYNGETVCGDYSKPVKITYSVPMVTFSSAKPVAGGGLKLKWKKVKGADGYEIRRSVEESGKYKKLKLVQSPTAQSCTLSAAEADGSYYYKVRAYRIVNGKKVYGEYSVAKKAEVVVFAHSGETYIQKCRRVFGTGRYKRYASESAAKRYMTVIRVNVWDFDSKGNKVTKQKTIMVHKNLAPTVEQIFKEIYEGEEKFPIKAVGGFSWRGEGSVSEHNQGTALDINPNENYMVEGDGTISSGSYWKPGKDPYSIPADGEVVKIFAKYGFYWGGLGWGSGRKDYMHFSYFGT